MKIVVFCNAGMSSGLIVNKMKHAAGPDVEVVAYQSSKMDAELPSADVVLLSPALRFMLKKVEEKCAKLGIPCAVIDMKAYGFADGAAVYKQVQEMLKK